MKLNKFEGSIPTSPTSHRIVKRERLSNAQLIGVVFKEPTSEVIVTSLLIMVDGKDPVICVSMGVACESTNGEKVFTDIGRGVGFSC